MYTINCFRFILFETFDNLFEGIDVILESRKIIHAVPKNIGSWLLKLTPTEKDVDIKFESM